MAVLRKTNSHSVDICRLIKKIDNVKQDPRRKPDSSAYEFHIKERLCNPYQRTLFTSNRAEIGR